LGYHREQLIFHSKSGALHITRSGHKITMDFPAKEPVEIVEDELIEKALGIKPASYHKSVWDYMVVLNSQAEIEALKPDFNQLKKHASRGLIATAKGNESDFVSRCFYPQSGIDEDPATGSAHVVMVPYWAKIFGKNKLSAIQLSARRGYLDCELTGDRVLMSVANRLEEIADGLGFVARLGGDEFTFVYENVESEHAFHETGLRLVEAFQQLLAVDDRDFSVSVSVGASIFPQHGRDAAELLRAADSALFSAKELGRSRLAVFTPELIESAAARFSIEQGLRRALEHGEFELVYQPEIDLATMEVELVEALIRWRMPDGRLALPGEFLGIAEQSGLITEISKWVLRTAVQGAAQWHHGGWPGARVAINISPRQLLDPRFAESLDELLREFALPAQAIELELTETVIQTGSTTIAALRLLQSQGFRIALDDFGTGYSSLTSLEQLPLSRIKLDRSLIASIDSSQRSAAIARAIIDLCEGLGLAVTAEGVERPTQLAWLLGKRSIFVQGYLLSEAVPFDEVLRRRSTVIPKLQNLLLSLEGNAYRRSAGDTRTKASKGSQSSPTPGQRAIKS